MKATVGVYDHHEKAIKAVKYLVKNGIDEKEISLIGRGEIVEDDMHINSIKGLKKSPVPIGVVGGAILGVLTGAGMIALPGFGFVFLAGKFVGALGGVGLGMAAGGLTSILMSIGFKKDQVVRYKKHMEAGNFLVVINGSEEHIALANTLLTKHAQHLELHHKTE